MGCRSRFPTLLALILVLVPIGGFPPRADAYPRTLRDAAGRTVELSHRPRRVFGGGLNVDSTLLKLIPPDRVVAVSRFAQNPDYSFVADSASRLPAYPQVRAEIVLKHDPDLVLLTRYTRADIRNQILNLDVPVVMTRPVNTRRDIRENTLLIGRAVGAETAARRWLRTMDQHLRSHDPLPDPPRVLYYTYSGTVPGRDTLPNLILESAGIRNVAAEVGVRGWKVLSPEKILSSRPDWFLLESKNRDQLVGTLKNDPALGSLKSVREDRFISVAPRYLTVASPYLYRAAEFWHHRFSRE